LDYTSRPSYHQRSYSNTGNSTKRTFPRPFHSSSSTGSILVNKKVDNHFCDYKSHTQSLSTSLEYTSKPFQSFDLGAGRNRTISGYKSMPSLTNSNRANNKRSRAHNLVVGTVIMSIGMHECIQQLPPFTSFCQLNCVVSLLAAMHRCCMLFQVLNFNCSYDLHWPWWGNVYKSSVWEVEMLFCFVAAIVLSKLYCDAPYIFLCFIIVVLLTFISSHIGSKSHIINPWVHL